VATVLSACEKEADAAEAAAEAAAGDAAPSTAAPPTPPRSAAAVAALPPSLVRVLPDALASPAASDSAAERAAAALAALAAASPDAGRALRASLVAGLHSLSPVVRDELTAVADGASSAPGAPTAPPAGGGAAGARLVRLARALRGLAADRGGDEDAAADLDAAAAALDPLWADLERAAAAVERGLAPPAARARGAPAGAAPMLPPGAAALLPAVEAFFLLAAPPAGSAGSGSPARAASAGLAASPPRATPGSMGAAGTPIALPTPALALAAASAAAARGAASPTPTPRWLRFARSRRTLVNALLRSSPGLLDAALAPLLARSPGLVDFDNKRGRFRAALRREAAPARAAGAGALRIAVRRDHAFEDSFHQLRMRSPAELRAKLAVTFAGEDGVDAGGVTREWYGVMARAMFDPNAGLFVRAPEGGTAFQPNPASVVQSDPARGTSHLDFFRFVGRVVGKALADGHLLDAYFTRSFYKHMLGAPLTHADVEAVDPAYHRNLVWMLENPVDGVLDLTFAVEVDFFGRRETVDLVPGGAAIKVTDANKRAYVDAAAAHRVTTAIRDQTAAFLAGFWDMVPQGLLAPFDDQELELLISGLPEIDVADLKASAEYAGGYSPASPQVVWLWTVVASLDAEDLARFVQFVTGTSKVPLDGFAALQGVNGPQRLSVHRAHTGPRALPTAHTCFNQLDLPEYESADALRERLLLAIRECVSFGFA
jgi:E3 ubiquitin-protein ligase HUWE1